MSILFYKRPNYVARMPGPMDQANYDKILEKQKSSIPPQLSFEMIVANRAMPPVGSFFPLYQSASNPFSSVLARRFHGLPVICVS